MDHRQETVRLFGGGGMPGENEGTARVAARASRRFVDAHRRRSGLAERLDEGEHPLAAAIEGRIVAPNPILETPANGGAGFGTEGVPIIVEKLKRRFLPSGR
jgi:hypothetical protein